MANIRIDDLDPVPTLIPSAVIVLEQSGISYKSSIADLLLNANTPATFSDLSVTNSFNVSGNINVEQLNMRGTTLTLNSDFTVGSPFSDVSIQVNRGSAGTVTLFWDETEDRWSVGPLDFHTAGSFIGDLTGDVTGNVSGTLTGNVIGNVTGDVTGTVSSLSNLDTGDLPEGSNLYYTDARADARIAALVDGAFIEAQQPKASPIPSTTTSSARTFGLSDESTMVVLNSSAQRTWTVPTNASVGFPLGTYIGLIQQGAGAIQISGASGVNILNVDGFFRTAGIGAVAGLYKLGTDTWVLSGALQP